MKVVILAGGYGLRFGEETTKLPKPLVKINNIALIEYVMQAYLNCGYKDFIICTGFKFKKISNHFRNYKKFKKIGCKIKIVNTGLKTNTGGRIKKISKYLKKDTNKDFFVSYGDCISNINLKNELKFHNKHKKLATLTAVTMPSRFGSIKIKNNKILKFVEKPIQKDNWINGGFFIFSKKCLKFFKSNQTILENEPMKKLSRLGELMAFKHKGFWQPIDNIKDKNYVEKILKDKNKYKIVLK